MEAPMSQSAESGCLFDYTYEDDEFRPKNKRNLLKIKDLSKIRHFGGTSIQRRNDQKY